MDNAKRIQKMESAVAALKSQAKVAARKLRVAKLKATLKAKRDASKHHPKEEDGLCVHFFEPDCCPLGCGDL